MLGVSDSIPTLQVGSWAKRIIIQMDNAGGHGGGRGDINRTTIKKLDEKWNNTPWSEENRLCSNGNKPKIEFWAQPPHSPDFNLLDLGAWWSIDCMVRDLKAKAAQGILRPEEARQAVKNGWVQWNGKEKLTKLFNDLHAIFTKVREIGGGNKYRMPHRARWQRAPRAF